MYVVLPLTREDVSKGIFARNKKIEIYIWDFGDHKAQKSNSEPIKPDMKIDSEQMKTYHKVSRKWGQEAYVG